MDTNTKGRPGLAASFGTPLWLPPAFVPEQLCSNKICRPRKTHKEGNLDYLSCSVYSPPK